MTKAEHAARIREIGTSLSVLADTLEYWITAIYELADKTEGERGDTTNENAAFGAAVLDAADDDGEAEAAVDRLAELLGIGGRSPQ